MPTPRIGQILHYKLSGADVKKLGPQNVKNPEGATHREGDVVPLIVVRVYENEFGNKPGVNGQAFLDSPKTLWVASAGKGEDPGQWTWAPT